LEEVDLGWCLGVNAQTGCIVALAKGCQKLVKVPNKIIFLEKLNQPVRYFTKKLRYTKCL